DSENNEVVQTSSNKKGSATNQNKSNELNELTKEVSNFSFFFSLYHSDWVLLQIDFGIKEITSSSAWRQEFERCAKGKNLRGLISGYGICWNIKYQSQECAYEAREVSL
ncbi:hypothetical protein VP01_8435g2, partial [Puccinia sorghi]